MDQFLYDLLVFFAPAFLLGILHTAIPCEDKAIFFFWSFGISKTPKKSLFILSFYGFGVMSSNMAIAIIGILITHSPRLLVPDFSLDPYQFSFLGGLTSLIAAIILFFVINYSNYTEKIHSRFKNEISKLHWDKNRTPFLFGMVVGFAPCIFEFFIYANVITLSLSYDIFMGIIYLFYFWLGTFTGLFLIALAKMGTSQIFHPNIKQKKTIFIIMIFIIIVFNIIVIIASLFRINIYPSFNS
ncbi:MAG: sulfite exporter TauE/SafE family protein [Candidatus Lokiarchaeota archaeon]|nr:sulfite exporter TauE/SafE family protein [Candidatus Lokiarchaeota archaeon]